MNKLLVAIVLSTLVLSNCGRGTSEEEQAMANALGLTVEEMRALPDEEFTKRINKLNEIGSEG